ncbi:CD99 molecule isoform 2-T2 [Pholidichthys leucotaenia]
MKFALRTAVLLFLLGAAACFDGFDLSDALDTATEKPKEYPKPQPKDDGGLDLFDALEPDLPAEKPKEKPKPKDDDFGAGKPKEYPKPQPKDDGGFDLSDALRPGQPADKPNQKGSEVSGGRSFDDSDLLDVGDSNYKPDGGRSGGGGMDPNRASHGDSGGDAGQAQVGSGPLAGIISAVGVALVGAASSYFAYQKKKLCFKMQGGADPERGKSHHGPQSEPQLFSNLLQNN